MSDNANEPDRFVKCPVCGTKVPVYVSRMKSRPGTFWDMPKRIALICKHELSEDEIHGPVTDDREGCGK